jgi:hypothetical protein
MDLSVHILLVLFHSSLCVITQKNVPNLATRKGQVSYKITTHFLDRVVKKNSLLE